MRRHVLPFLVCLAARGAVAQAPPRTPPYEVLTAVAAVPVDAAAAETFAAIRAAIAAKDEGRLAARLAADFVAISCPTDPTARCGPRPLSASERKHAPVERLRLALCCGGKDDPSMAIAARAETMFGMLDSLLQGGAPAASPDGLVCDPAIPAIDRSKAAALAKRLDIETASLRLAAASIEARSRPDRTAPLAARLAKNAVVPLLTTQATPAPDGWTALALPTGGIGYAEGVTLDELAPESLCLRKGKDGWKAALLIGRQS